MVDGSSRWLDLLGSLKFFVPHWPIGTASSFPVFRWWMMMVTLMASAPVSGHPTGSKANRENEVDQLALSLSVVSDHWLMSLSAAISGVFIPSKCQGCQGTTIGYQTAGFNASCEANATCTWGQKHGLWQFWQTLQFFQQLFNRPFKNLIFAFPPFDRWFSHQKPHFYRWFFLWGWIKLHHFTGEISPSITQLYAIN